MELERKSISGIIRELGSFCEQIQGKAEGARGIFTLQGVGSGGCLCPEVEPGDVRGEIGGEKPLCQRGRAASLLFFTHLQEKLSRHQSHLPALSWKERDNEKGKGRRRLERGCRGRRQGDRKRGQRPLLLHISSAGVTAALEHSLFFCTQLRWRIPGTEEPGGLPSMGSHRVGHD